MLYLNVSEAQEDTREIYVLLFCEPSKASLLWVAFDVLLELTPLLLDLFLHCVDLILQPVIVMLGEVELEN